MLLDDEKKWPTVLQFINVQVFAFAGLSFESVVVVVFAVFSFQMNSPLRKPISFVRLKRQHAFRLPVWLFVSDFAQLVHSVCEEPRC